MTQSKIDELNINKVQSLEVVSTTLWLHRTNSKTLVIYVKHNDSNYDPFPFGLVKIDSRYISPETSKAIAYEIAKMAGSFDSIPYIGEELAGCEGTIEPLREDVWVEGGIFGEYHVMIKIEGVETPFRAAMLEYDYAYTSNAEVKKNAKKVACLFGAKEDVDVRSHFTLTDHVQNLYQEDFATS
ncbi:hypothetical protein [Vibrio sp. D431a]|uniref:hypothetical protein n=1 Tax=Vibrio sp. D431a TaxID=2837388 RepID=UPI002556BCB7|nr:hypothetical protein [Vibrio sp. D431a]MDK9789855.1 hypothetical protein [Vibrio sp. D431a]